jgi:serine/threonine protein kinase
LKPQFLIIDDDAEYRSLLSHHVSTKWPQASIRSYDPEASGRLPESFAGASCDVVLLASSAGAGEGLEWLRQFGRVSTFPPVLFVGDGDEREIVAAIRAGAADYISRGRLEHRSLIEILTPLLSDDKSTSRSGQYFVDRQELTDGMPQLKGYEFQRRIALNEMSAVYLATERTRQRTVALKVLRQMPDQGADAAFDRFLQEYELIAKIDHPNIVRIFDLGVADDHAFIAMEYCSKGSLKQRITHGLESGRAYELMREIAGALGELHRVGITHRDLKPTNVMFRENDSVVLIDFGLAKQSQLRAEITGTGEIFGTPYYMSPEQGHGGEADARADLYALGVIFYEMLTGQKPYDGDTAMAVIVKHCQAPEPVLPDEYVRFQPCLERMMAKQPEDRFQSVAELLAWSPTEAIQAAP